MGKCCSKNKKGELSTDDQQADLKDKSYRPEDLISPGTSDDVQRLNLRPVQQNLHDLMSPIQVGESPLKKKIVFNNNNQDQDVASTIDPWTRNKKNIIEKTKFENFQKFITQTLLDLTQCNQEVKKIIEYLKTKQIKLPQKAVSLRSLQSNQYTDETSVFSVKIYKTPIDIFQAEEVIIQDFRILVNVVQLSEKFPKKLHLTAQLPS